MADPPGVAGPGAGYPQWTVNTTGWVVAEVVDAEEKAVAEAATFPDKLVFFTSKAAADNYVASQGETPATSLVPPSAITALNAGSEAAGAGVTVADFLGRLTSKNFVPRLVEIVVGGVLLIVAVKAMAAPATTPVTTKVSSALKWVK